MRLVIDSLIVVMLLAVVGGLLVLHSQRKQAERELAQTQQALSALHAQTAYHASVKSALAGHEQVLVYIEPTWFGDGLPSNQLVSGDRPWLDLAPPGDMSDHPPDPIILNDQQAAFWYNPTLGVFRARVQPQLSEGQTLELYNQVNTSALLAFEQAPSPDRRPMAHAPGQTPSRQYASLAAGWDSAAPAVEAELHAPAAPIEAEVVAEHAAPVAAIKPLEPTTPTRPRLGDPVSVPPQPAVIHEVASVDETPGKPGNDRAKESPAVDDSPYPETPEPDYPGSEVNVPEPTPEPVARPTLR